MHRPRGIVRRSTDTAPELVYVIILVADEVRIEEMEDAYGGCNGVIGLGFDISCNAQKS